MNEEMNELNLIDLLVGQSASTYVVQPNIVQTYITLFEVPKDTKHVRLTFWGKCV